MNKFIVIIFLAFISYIVYSSYNEKTEIPEKKKITRWYTQEQVLKGEKVFNSNCVFCHKTNAVGTKIWKKMLPNGHYPPPPLNGTAHAWHHSFSQTIDIITNGGKSYQGLMPSFKNKLSKDDIVNVTSYFQNFWNEEIYELWIKNEERLKKRKKRLLKN